MAKMPATIRTIATTARMRRFTAPSSLPPQRRHRSRWRRRAAGGRPARRRAASRRAPRGRHIHRPMTCPEGGQRQIWKDAGAALRRFVNDHLIAVLQNLFHRFEIEALLRDILRDLEGAVDRKEAIGVALGAGCDLLPIGFRLLLDPNRVAARPRDDVVAV